MGRKRLGEAEASRLRFDALAELLDNGRRELPIAATFPLTQVRDAYRQLARRHTLGKSY